MEYLNNTSKIHYDFIRYASYKHNQEYTYITLIHQHHTLPSIKVPPRSSHRRAHSPQPSTRTKKQTNPPRKDKRAKKTPPNMPYMSLWYVVNNWLVDG
jgi:hypothetical protein